MNLIDLLNIHEEKMKQVSEAKSDDDLGELIDKYIQANRMYHFEGSRGVRYLDKIINILGYRDFDYFLEDNPGAQEAIVEWIKEQNNSEWTENFADILEDEDQDEEKD